MKKIYYLKNPYEIAPDCVIDAILRNDVYFFKILRKSCVRHNISYYKFLKDATGILNKNYETLYMFACKSKSYDIVEYFQNDKIENKDLYDYKIFFTYTYADVNRKIRFINKGLYYAVENFDFKMFKIIVNYINYAPHATEEIVRFLLTNINDLDKRLPLRTETSREYLKYLLYEMIQYTVGKKVKVNDYIEKLACKDNMDKI